MKNTSKNSERKLSYFGKSQVQEEQRVPNKLDPKRYTPRHIIIKMPKVKDKERILKAVREEIFPTKKFP